MANLAFHKYVNSVKKLFLYIIQSTVYKLILLSVPSIELSVTVQYHQKHVIQHTVSIRIFEVF